MRRIVPRLFVAAVLAVAAIGVGVGSERADATPVSWTKEFLDDPIVAGGTSTVRFTMQSDNAPQELGLAFTDNLPAGMEVASPPNTSNTCAGTLTANAGGTTISLVNGIAPGTLGSCQIEVDVTVASAGSYVNTTSDLTWTGGNLPGASDTLTVVDGPTWSKEFTDDPVAPGDIATLQFQVQNPNPVALSDLAFTDDLDATLSGLQAVGLPAADICGAGSAITGTSVLTFTGGNLAAGGSCIFEVTVQVPGDASPGQYPNTTSTITATADVEAVDSSPASDDLDVQYDPPTFSKAFSPSSILAGSTTRLTFTIDNPAAPVAVTDLDFTDAMPAAIQVASPANASTTCVGGAIAATPGSNTVSYTGGLVGAGETCIVGIDVVGTAGGEWVNTSGDLTSSLGNSGPATATLTVSGVSSSGAVHKTALTPLPIEPGGTVEFRITVSNTGTPPLTSVRTVDERTPSCDRDEAFFGTIESGDSVTYTCAATNVAESFENTVMAFFDGPGGNLTNVATAAVSVDTSGTGPGTDPGDKEPGATTDTDGGALPDTGGDNSLPLGALGFLAVIGGALLSVCARPRAGGEPSR